MSERVGVFGGMFDPVHDGHMAIARHALELLRLDRLLLVPCNLPNHREAPVCGAEHRIDMLRLACAGEARMEVDSIEIDQGGVSYTARTLERIRKRLPRASIVLVLGLDAFLGLPGWRDPGRLFELAHILVIARGKLPMDYDMAGRFGGVMTAGPEQLFGGSRGNVLLTEEPRLDISSSAARELLARDREAPLPAAVLAYVRENGLYRAGMS
ncbi:MAG: nicotinate (nicotinamide) nucleotide adenylyltransferase [Gammaproteobacteria bacterium]|nr:nicotinate (nicotinamide) nucleotide adenylyltransferase [Gammaproteobacteria bacterium]